MTQNVGTDKKAIAQRRGVPKTIPMLAASATLYECLPTTALNAFGSAELAKTGKRGESQGAGSRILSWSLDANCRTKSPRADASRLASSTRERLPYFEPIIRRA